MWPPRSIETARRVLLLQFVEHDLPAEVMGRIGRTLRGKWHIDSLLDVGGMAAVYAATHRNGSRGAVKIMHSERSADPKVVARFLGEGTLANLVEHDGALNVLDDDVDENGCPFLVMELLEGTSLHARFESNGCRMEVQEVLLVVDQLLDVLAAAHDAGVVHRDIKPENVFLLCDGRVKLLDFGVARLALPGSAARTTLDGITVGTPAFMSPEQARGQRDAAGPGIDVWGVGATMFTLLSGRFVFDGEFPLDLLAAVASGPARSLATVMPNAPPSVVALVDRALAQAPKDRWLDARSMREAVAEVYATVHGVPIPRRGRPVPRPLRATPLPVAASIPRDVLRNASTAVVRVPRRLRASSRSWVLAAGGAVAILAVLFFTSAFSSAFSHHVSAAVELPLAAADRPSLEIPLAPAPAAAMAPPVTAASLSALPPQRPLRTGSNGPRHALPAELFDRRH
jgi:serine/threonine protein kinase